MERQIVFAEAASWELEEAVRYYDTRSPGLGLELIEEVERATDRIRQFPEVATPVRNGLRRLVLPRFPYSVIYTVIPTQIRILAVAHQRRRPFYWRGGG